MPPGHDEAPRRQRKAKHIAQFRGPLRVDEKLSTSTFLLSCYFNPERKFKRHLTNIRRWIGPLPSRDENANGVPPASHDDVAVGDFLFVRGSNAPADKRIDLIRVSECDHETLKVRGYGRTGPNPSSCSFRPVFIREDGFVQLVAPRRNQRVTPSGRGTSTLRTLTIWSLPTDSSSLLLAVCLVLPPLFFRASNR